jgi:hypothetical protein
LLFPDGDETNVSVSPWTEVTNLKALAMSTLSCKPRAKKQKVQVDDGNEHKLVADDH